MGRLARRFMFGGSEWQLTDVGGAKLFLQPDPGFVTATAGAVSELAERSGAGLITGDKLTQTSGSNQPTLNTSDADFNGRPSLDFAGDYFIGATFATPISAAKTIYIVAKVASAGGSVRYVFDTHASGTGRNLVYLNASDSPRFSNGSEIGNTTSIVGAAVVICLVGNGASSAIYVNDMVTPFATGNAGSTAWDGITLGARYTAANFLSNFKLASFGTFDAVHDLTKRGQAASGLSARFGISVTV